jgi:hypothetical protein
LQWGGGFLGARGVRGTAIKPLADEVGASVNALGAVYVGLVIALESIYISLSMSTRFAACLPTTRRGASQSVSAFTARPQTSTREVLEAYSIWVHPNLTDEHERGSSPAVQGNLYVIELVNLGGDLVSIHLALFRLRAVEGDTS